MKTKIIFPLLALTVLSVALGMNAPAQTNVPDAPKGLQVQAQPELAGAQLVPSQPMPGQPQPAKPVLPLQPDGPKPNRSPLFTNHPSVFQSHAPGPTNGTSALTNHPPELLPGDI